LVGCRNFTVIHRFYKRYATAVHVRLADKEGMLKILISGCAAFVPAATPAQVLKAVTLGAPAGNGGGFFPDSASGFIPPSSLYIKRQNSFTSVRRIQSELQLASHNCQLRMSTVIAFPPFSPYSMCRPSILSHCDVH
jgi:hypothetical protein